MALAAHFGADPPPTPSQSAPAWQGEGWQRALPADPLGHQTGGTVGTHQKEQEGDSGLRAGGGGCFNRKILEARRR